MQKPKDYDSVQVGGDYTPVELGGHHLIIKKVKEQESSSGRPMIVVFFDFAPNDKQPGFFADQFESDIRPEKKWPFQGTQWIMTQDAKDPSKTSRNFKAFITSVERSNNMVAEWGDVFCDQFTGKKVGGVYGIVEEEYNGEVKQRRRLRYFCEDGKVADAKIPDPKLLNRNNSTYTPTPASASFMQMSDSEQEALPF